MNRPSVYGDAGLAPAVGLIRSLSASSRGVTGAGIVFEQNNTNDTTGAWVTLGIGVPFSTGGPRPGV